MRMRRLEYPSIMYSKKGVFFSQLVVIVFTARLVAAAIPAL